MKTLILLALVTTFSTNVFACPKDYHVCNMRCCKNTKPPYPKYPIGTDPAQLELMECYKELTEQNVEPTEAFAICFEEMSKAQ